MKQYVIDELRLTDYQKVKTYLDKKFTASPIPGIYWIELEQGLMGRVQAKHRECRPFYFAVELEESRVSAELLVRSAQRVRCDCIGYADNSQRTWLMDKMDAIFTELDISI